MQLDNRSRLRVRSRFSALIGIMCLLSDFAPARPQTRNHPDAQGLGTTARQAVIEIFRNRDSTAMDRFFSEPFVQHDPTIADGLSGLSLRDRASEFSHDQHYDLSHGCGRRCRHASFEIRRLARLFGAGHSV